MSETFIFSATAGKKENSILYNTCKDQDIDIFIKENNKKSLHKIYNEAIDFALQENVKQLVLVHDDVILENFSEQRLERLFKKFDDVGCAGTTEVKLQRPVLWHLMGGGFNSGNLFGAVAHGTQDDKHMTAFGPYPKRVVLLDGVFIAIKKEVFEKVGNFKEWMKSAEDYELWFRIAKEYKIYSINEPLVEYRVHQNKMSTNYSKMEFYGIATLYYALENDNNIDDIEAYYKLYEKYASKHFSLKNMQEFRKYFWIAFAYKLPSFKMWVKFMISFVPFLLKLRGK